jgi:pimeloyl-ACP methyl ester carboxylesterase
MNRLLAIVATIFSIGALLLAGRHQQFQYISAAGAKLRMLSAGQGGPTVVFEAGSGSPLETWTRIQPAVSSLTRTVSYDRAGNGLSEKGATPRDGRHIAAELHQALQNAQVPPPYVLVGHSLGGPFIRVFAAMYPNETAGLILVDPTQEDLIAWAKSREPAQPPKHPFRPHDEVDCAPLTFAQTSDSSLPNVPIVLLSGAGPRNVPGFLSEKFRREVQKDRDILYPAKVEFHRAWVESFAEGRLVVTENSGHGIPWEEPELVIKTIREVVARVRGSPSSNIRRDKP